WSEASRHSDHCLLATIPWKWWTGMDSNHRRREPTRLQRVPFSRSGTRPPAALYRLQLRTQARLAAGSWGDLPLTMSHAQPQLAAAKTRKTAAPRAAATARRGPPGRQSQLP